MGLLGGFKAKFRGGQTLPKTSKNKSNVVCVKYNVFNNEFDSQPGTSSNHHDISQAPKPPHRTVSMNQKKIEDEIRKQIQSGMQRRKENGINMSNGSETAQSNLRKERNDVKQEVPNEFFKVQLPVDARQEVRNEVKEIKHPVEVKQSEEETIAADPQPKPRTKFNLPPIQEPVQIKQQEIARLENPPEEQKPPEVNYSRHPLMAGASPIQKSFTNDDEEEDEEEKDSGNFKIHFVSHDKTYATDEEEEEEEEEESDEELSSPPPSPMDYSSQAASIFFGGDDEDEELEQVLQRPRNFKVQFKDDDQSSVSSSASA